MANRRFFDEILKKEWNRSMREHCPLGVLFLDIDYFKQYNDLYGHIKGDKALISVAQTLLSCTKRSGDLVARYGGDEFIILLPNMSHKAVIEISKKVQIAINKLHIPYADSKISPYITTTIGTASIKPSTLMTPMILLKQADLALNNGKQNKRNSINY